MDTSLEDKLLLLPLFKRPRKRRPGCRVLKHVENFF